MCVHRSFFNGGVLLALALVVFGWQPTAYATDPETRIEETEFREREAERDEEQLEQIQQQLAEYEAARRKQAEELKKRLTVKEWRPTHEQTKVIEVGKDADGKPLHTFCMNRDGNILAGCGGNRTEFDYVGGASRSKEIVEQGEIRIYSPAGELVDVWNVDVTPRAIAVAPDGMIFVAGQGRMAKLNVKGETVLVADTPLVRNYKQEKAKEEADCQSRRREKSRRREEESGAGKSNRKRKKEQEETQTRAQHRCLAKLLGTANPGREPKSSIEEMMHGNRPPMRDSRSQRHRRRRVGRLPCLPDGQGIRLRRLANRSRPREPQADRHAN
jgi:hypothetical protein